MTAGSELINDGSNTKPNPKIIAVIEPVAVISFDILNHYEC